MIFLYVFIYHCTIVILDLFVVCCFLLVHIKPFRYIDVSFNRVITVYKHDSRAQNIIFVGAEKGIHQTKGYYVWRMVLDKGSEVTYVVFQQS